MKNGNTHTTKKAQVRSSFYLRFYSFIFNVFKRLFLAKTTKEKVMGMGQQELKDIIEKHGKWLRGEPDGERADLRSADLRSADLRYANLSYADLRSANLSYANLSYADLRSANLSYADLSYADLSYADLRSADLSSIKNDFFARLLLAKNEVIGLYDYHRRGLVDGRSYEGECACFVGTVAKVCKQPHNGLESGLKPESDSPTEKWYLAILKGHTPENNAVAKITCEWIEEFAKEHEIALPTYKMVSSSEFPAAFEAPALPPITDFAAPASQVQV